MPNPPIRHFASSRLAKLALVLCALAFAGGLEISHLIDLTRLSDRYRATTTLLGSTAGNYPIRISFRTVHLAQQDLSTSPIRADGRKTGSPTHTPVSPEHNVGNGKSEHTASEPGHLSDRHFDEAFRDLGQSGQSVSKATVGQTHILSVNYSIDKPEEVPGSIQVRKAVEINGVKKGKVGLRIVNDSTIMIKSSEVLALFGDHISPKTVTALGSSAGGTKYIDFNALREAGINVRYDAAHDMVLMTSHAS